MNASLSKKQHITLADLGAVATGEANIGWLAAAYESSNNPGMIGRVSGDVGGASYGLYQFASANGVMTGYLNGYGAAFNSDYMLGGFKPGSMDFDTQFKQIASAYPNELADSMFGARVQSAFMPAVNIASSLGFDVNDPGIQSALFSVSTNHGGYRNIIQGAAEIFGGDMTGVSAENQIDAIYLARSNYVESLSSVTSANKSSLIARYNDESNYAKIISALSK